ncbi:MAG: DUF4097 family beta strand repeat-containing protein [Bacteroidota bacterium]
MKKSLFIIPALFISLIGYSQKQTDFNLDETYPIDLGGTIYMNINDAKVTIKGEDRKDVKVKIDYVVRSKGIEWGNREFSVDVDSRGGDLYIKEYRQGNTTIMGYVSVEYSIEINAPFDVSLDIRGDDDDYNITAINGEVSINADDADVVMKNCKGNRFFFDIDDGDIFMDEGKGQLTARVDDGDIEIRNANFENIDYRGDDGDVAIETSIGPNAIFRFSSDDSTIDLVITEGGGTFSIDHDNGRIDYDNNFRLMEKDDDRTVLSLTGGRAKIVIKGDDIRVNLASTFSN